MSARAWVRVVWGLALCTALLALGLALTANGQTAPSGANVPRMRVEVRLVNVFVQVTDPSGSPVGGLAKENFALAEDGRPQNIAVFERQSAMPLSLVLAIDTSGSTRKDLPLEQKAAHNFVHALLRPVDQMALMEFNSDVREVVDFTNRPPRLDAGIDNLRFGPATALYDAVYQAAQRLDGRDGRRVLVLISDGGNTVKGVDYASALEQAVRGEVMVYSIIDVPIAADAGRDTGGEHAMITLSQETGGKYFYADAAHLDDAFRKVSDDLRTQYLLGYYPSRHRPGDDDFHSIGVALKGVNGGENYGVRHRTGYYTHPME